jgi:hypothetical protein
MMRSNNRLVASEDQEWKLAQEMWKKRKEHGIFSGLILQAYNLSFKKMQSWSDFTEDHRLRRQGDSGEMAKQYCWRDDLCLGDLEDDIVEKVYIRK